MADERLDAATLRSVADGVERYGELMVRMFQGSERTASEVVEAVTKDIASTCRRQAIEAAAQSPRLRENLAVYLESLAIDESETSCALRRHALFLRLPYFEAPVSQAEAECMRELCRMLVTWPDMPSWLRARVHESLAELLDGVSHKAFPS